MEHQKYRDALLLMWDYISAEDYNSIFMEEINDSEEYTDCGLCNPQFGAAYNRTLDQACPFDKRSAKEMSPSPCMDTCRVFEGSLNINKAKILVSKFMIKMFTAEAIASVKSIAKAGRGQKGFSKEAADNHIVVTNKIRKHIKAFGGYNFHIEGKLIKANRSEG